MKRLVPIFLLLLCSFGCNGGDGSGGGGGTGGGGGSATPTPDPSGKGRLYVVNQSPTTGNSILAFDRATTVDGNTAPTTKIAGTATTINAASFLWLDISTDRLYVANTGGNSILVYDTVSSKSGDIAPTRTITSTGYLDQPVALYLDSSLNRLYVSNQGGKNILVFSNASSASGNIATPVVILSSSPAFNKNAGIFVDKTADLLYVADSNDNSIKVFNTPSALSGTVSTSPARRITSSNIQKPIDLTINSAGELIVLNNQGSTINTFANATSLNLSVTPTRSLAGSNTKLKSPQQMAYDETNDVLYVANGGGGSVIIFSKFSLMNGNFGPTRKVSGDQTELDVPAGQSITAAGIAVISQ